MSIQTITRHELAFILQVSYKTALRLVAALRKKYPNFRIRHKREIPLNIIEAEYGFRVCDIVEVYNILIEETERTNQLIQCPECGKHVKPCVRHRFLFAMVGESEQQTIKRVWLLKKHKAKPK